MNGHRNETERINSTINRTEIHEKLRLRTVSHTNFPGFFSNFPGDLTISLFDQTQRISHRVNYPTMNIYSFSLFIFPEEMNILIEYLFILKNNCLKFLLYQEKFVPLHRS